MVSLWKWSTERSRSNIRELKGWLRTKRRNTSRNESGLHISYYTNFYNNHILNKMGMKRCQGAAHCLLIFIATQCGHEVGCKTMREKEKRNQEGTELMGRSNHRETIRLDISSSVSELNTSVHLPKLLCIATSGTILLCSRHWCAHYLSTLQLDFLHSSFLEMLVSSVYFLPSQNKAVFWEKAIQFKDRLFTCPICRYCLEFILKHLKYMATFL